MTTTGHDQADAKHRELVVVVWRDWRAYLAANLDLIAAQQESNTEADFEQGSVANSRETRARGIIAAIPPDRRRLFATVCARRRAALVAELDAARRSAANGSQARGLDPDAVDTRLYQLLLDEAEGRTEDRLGRAPRDEEKFYGLDVEALLAAPDAATYRIRGGAGSTRGRIIGIAAIAVFGIGAILFSIFSGRPSTGVVSVAKSQAKANDTVLIAWGVESVVVDVAGDVLTLPVTTPPDRGRWPTEGAGVEPGARTPMTICLPAAQLGRAQAIELRGSGDAPDRRYRLSQMAQHADVIVVPCQGSAAPHYGVLLTTLPLGATAIGARAMVGDQSLLLESFRTEGRDDDPTLPPDQARIIVTFTDAAQVDWIKLNPVLTTEAGQRVNAGETTVVSGTTELRYLINAVTAPMQALLTLTPPDSARAVRWRGTITPPESRDDVVRRTVLIDAMTAVRSTDGLSITLTARSNSPYPLVLTEADLHLTSTADNMPIEVQPFSIDLARNVPTSLTVRTATSATSDAWALRLGNATYTLALPERRE